MLVVKYDGIMWRSSSNTQQTWDVDVFFSLLNRSIYINGASFQTSQTTSTLNSRACGTSRGLRPELPRSYMSLPLGLFTWGGMVTTQPWQSSYRPRPIDKTPRVPLRDGKRRGKKVKGVHVGLGMRSGQWWTMSLIPPPLGAFFFLGLSLWFNLLFVWHIVWLVDLWTTLNSFDLYWLGLRHVYAA